MVTESGHKNKYVLMMERGIKRTRLSHLWGMSAAERRRETHGPCEKGCLWSLAHNKHVYHKPPPVQTQNPTAPPVEGSAVCGGPTGPQPGLLPCHPPAARRSCPPSREAGRATLSTTSLRGEKKH